MFRPHFELFIDICGLPDQHKNESLHKTDFSNVVSDFLKEVYSAI